MNTAAKRLHCAAHRVGCRGDLLAALDAAVQAELSSLERDPAALEWDVRGTRMWLRAVHTRRVKRLGGALMGAAATNRAGEHMSCEVMAFDLAYP